MIKATNITKTFRSGPAAVPVLTDVSFSLEAGNTLAVLGKSGSGKTTLLNCLGGLDCPDRGTIVCFGTEITALPSRQLSRFQRTRLGFVFQHGNLLSYLTVRENIAFPLVLNRMSLSGRNRRIDELLEKTGLQGLGASRPRELSGGQAQRVAFARAIAHTPSLLLADEPTASLDTETGLALIRLMKRLAGEQGTTIIIATHDTDVLRHADMTLSLKDGRVAESPGR